jgi:hypothetical protein
MFDYELTSRAYMESETQRITLGLRQRDVVVLEALVEQYQYRLVRYLVVMGGTLLALLPAKQASPLNRTD